MRILKFYDRIGAAVEEKTDRLMYTYTPTSMENYKKSIPWFLLLTMCTALLLNGCAGSQDYLKEADEVSRQIIEDKQQEALGRVEPFTIIPPSDTLREKLLAGQNLPVTAPASFGSDNLDPIDKWPEIVYPEKQEDLPAEKPPWFDDTPIKINMLEALQIASRNSREYQEQKEDVFQSALALDLERDDFRHTFTGLLETLFETDMSGDHTVTGSQSSGLVGWRRKFESGVELVSAIAIDLVKLLTLDKESSFGIFADTSISIPLMRGAGKHIVTEDLTQAERDTIYAMYRFERFKRSFAVNITSQYLFVLQQLKEVATNGENYRNLVVAAQRARRMADSGRLPEVEVDQAVQNALRAKDRWYTTILTYERRLDDFKIVMGLPPDARLELDEEELVKLSESESMEDENETALESLTVQTPDRNEGNPYDLQEGDIIKTALDHRLDLRISQGQVFDKQRKVVVASNDLLPDVTILGSGQFGERRDISSADQPNSELRPERGIYSALLNVDLPFERTAERNAFRNSLIDLERSIRQMQELEDKVKLDVRNRLRDLAETSERIKIQTQAVAVANRRVASTNLFLEAGRVQMRDLLEAQEALVQTKNSLTGALVDYRVAELELQRDMGVLVVNEKGLYQEFKPKK